MVMDTLRATVRHLAAAPLDHTGRRLSGRRDRAVHAELHSGWDYRRLCSGLAADRGGVVCAADCVPADCWLTVNANKKCEVAFFPPHIFLYYSDSLDNFSSSKEGPASKVPSNSAAYTFLSARS